MTPKCSKRPRPGSDNECGRNEISTGDAPTVAPRSSCSPPTVVSPLRTRLLVPIILALISVFLIPTAEAKDPVKDFCRRWGHASTVIDDRLFIDGGYVNWEPIGADPKNYTNEWFLYHDLSSDSAGGLPPLVNLAKNNTIPNVIGGALWGDTVNKRVYAFGGEVNLATDAAPTGFTLYAYDALEDRWDKLDRPDIYLNSPSFGGNTAVSEQGLGFYYGGWLRNSTVPGWSGSPLASDSLIVYDMDRGTWENKTGPADNFGRAEGVMTYIPAGDNGFLIYFGGIKDPYRNGTVQAQEMTEILIYDFVSERWYSQKATGEVPDNRRRFCAGATWAKDYSSYNIYLYGGISVPPNSTAFDDVWILSIPSFQWIKWLPESQDGVNGDHPHHSPTCNVVGGGSQMIIVGGSFPYTEQCDSSPQYGSHNLMLGQQNAEKRKWETYNTTLDEYEVPDAIVAVVGGDAAGGATATVPEGGFDYADLGILMTRVASASTRSPTRDVDPDSGSPLSTGAIVGIAVGCGAALIAALTVGIILLRRHRRRNGPTRFSTVGPYSPTDPPEGGGTRMMWSPDSSQSPSSPMRYYPPGVQSGPMPGSYDAPVELPGAGNMNMGTWQPLNSPSLPIPSPTVGTTVDGKPEYAVAPPPVHMVSHSSGHSYIQTPTSAGYPANGMFGTPTTAGGYVSVSQGGSPLPSPVRHHGPMTPQELSTEPRDPAEEPRRDGPSHHTYYHPTQE